MSFIREKKIDSHFHGNDPSETRFHGAGRKRCGNDKIRIN